MQERAERLPLIVAGGDSDFGVHASSGRTSRVWIALALSDVRMRCFSVRSSIGRAFAIGASNVRERRTDPDVRFMRVLLLVRGAVAPSGGNTGLPAERLVFFL